MSKKTFARLSFIVPLMMLALAACKSPPVTEEKHEETKETSAPAPASPVKALDLLSDGAAFYLSVPKAVDEELLCRCFKSCAVTDEIAQGFAERINIAYLALDRRYNDTLLEARAECSPQNEGALQAASRTMQIGEGKAARQYEIMQVADALSLSFPAANIALLGADVAPGIALFDEHAYNKKTGHLLSDEVYEWLDGGGEKLIRFYALRPQSFLTILVGAKLNFKFAWVRGQMYVDPKLRSQYIMEMDFAFKDERTMAEGRAALETAFRLTGGAAYEKSATELIVTGIKISRRQLYKLFVL